MQDNASPQNVIERLEQLVERDPRAGIAWAGFSVLNADERETVATAMNAVPYLLNLAHAADTISLAAATSVGIEDWHIDDLRAALEPLFRAQEQS